MTRAVGPMAPLSPVPIGRPPSGQAVAILPELAAVYAELDQTAPKATPIGAFTVPAAPASTRHAFDF